jgi:hypothetical protein
MLLVIPYKPFGRLRPSSSKPSILISSSSTSATSMRATTSNNSKKCAASTMRSYKFLSSWKISIARCWSKQTKVLTSWLTMLRQTKILVKSNRNALNWAQFNSQSCKFKHSIKRFWTLWNSWPRSKLQSSAARYTEWRWNLKGSLPIFC